MKSFKKIICVFCIIALLVPFAAVGFAYDSTYNSDIDNPECVTKVENQGEEEACLAYGLTSTAGSYYCKMYNGGKSVDEVVFSGAKLKKKVGDSTNFGTVLYSSVKYNLGKNCYITGIENLTGRGERYLKQKIKENGAIFVAIPLTYDKWDDKELFDKENCVLNYYDGDFTSNENHAVSIIGWDDDECVWICKNSYGEKWGKNGFFYISYDYTPYFLYAASVEVTQYSDVQYVKAANNVSLCFFKVGAIGIRYCKNVSGAEIKVSAGGKEQLLTANLLNGYTVVPLQTAVSPSDITVTVKGSELPQSAVNLYLVKSGKPLSAPVKPAEEKLEITDIAEMNIILNGEFSASSSVDGNAVYHTVRLGSKNNIFVITPQDGYRFTEDTFVNIEVSVDGSGPFKMEGKTVKQLEENIEFEFHLDEDGKLSITSKNIGDAFAKGIRIELDESSKIKDVYRIGDNGSEEILEKSKYTVSPETIPDKGFYNAEIEIKNCFAADDFTVSVTRGGKEDNSPAQVTTKGDKTTVNVIIQIPEVTSIISMLISFWINIMALFADL
jgi:hypothetical protein